MIDYTLDDFTKRGRRYDLVVDVGGNRSLSACRRALAPSGTLILVGAGAGLGGPVGRFLAASLSSRLLRQPIVAFVSTESREDLSTLKELIEARRVTPVIDRIYPLRADSTGVRK